MHPVTPLSQNNRSKLFPLGCSKTYHGGSAMSVGVYHEFIKNSLKPTELSPYMERRLLAICREFLSRVNVDRIAPVY